MVADPSWLLDDGSEARIVGVANILIDIADVKWVEFIEKAWENNDG